MGGGEKGEITEEDPPKFAATGRSLSGERGEKEGKKNATRKPLVGMHQKTINALIFMIRKKEKRGDPNRPPGEKGGPG